MSYFAGKGAGKGWNLFNFLISAQELKTIILSMQLELINSDSRVPIDYSSTTIDSYIDNYAKYLDVIFNGTKFNSKNHWKIPSSVSISLLADLEILTWDLIKEFPEYKLSCLQRPVPVLSPLCVYVDEESLSLCTLNEEGYLGVQLQYPKCYSLDIEDHERWHETESLPEFKLYKNIIGSVKSISKKYRFIINGKEKSPNLFISKEFESKINGHWYLKKKQMTIVTNKTGS
jgi:hypothetical protein